MKTLRAILLASILIPLALIALLALWLSTVNPSRFIPLLEQELKAQNIEASFGGEVAWSFYPNIGLALNDLSIRQVGDDGEQPLATIAGARFSVQLMPLLKRQILISGVSLTGANIHLRVDKQGNSNWQRIAATHGSSANPASDTSESAAPLPAIEVEQLQIVIDQLSYADESSQQRAALNDIAVYGKNINLDGDNFAVSAEFTGKFSQLPAIQFKLASQLALSPAESKASAQDLTLRIIPSSRTAASLLLKAEMQVSYGEITQAKGILAMENFNLKSFLSALDLPLGETANTTSFTKLSVKTPFTWVDNELALTDSTVLFDHSKITGITKVKLSTDPNGLPITRSYWTIDNLNLDDYLPPSPNTASPATVSNHSASQPVALPLELLKTLDLDSSISINTLSYNTENLSNGKVSLSSKNGLTQFKLNFKQAFDSTVEVSGKLNAQQKPAQLTIDGASQGLNIGKLAKSFADFENIVGSSNTQFSAASSGVTDQDLINNLEAQFDVSSEELKFTPFNLEQQFCRAMSLLERKTLDTRNWEKFTVLSPVQIKANYQNQTLQLQNFSGKVHTLATSVSGRFNMKSGDFEFPVSLALSNVEASINRCSSVNKEWQSKNIPIVCKGNIDDIGANTCLPNLESLKALAKVKIDQRLAREKDKLEAGIAKQREQAKNQASDKLEQEASKLVDKETSDKLEDAWKNLIKNR